MTYPDKLDKSRPVYIAMDNTSSKNTTILNTIVNTLKNGGITNIKRKAIGPNELYTNISQVYNANLTNAIIINIANGVDPTNIRELGVWSKYLPSSCDNLNSSDKGGNDNRGRNVRERGNDAILAFFYDSCDFTRSTGTCYNRIKTRNPRTDVPDGGYWPSTTGYKPIDYCRDNKIYVVNQSSNQHNNPENADYTGEKVGAAILQLFESGSTTTTPTTPTTPTDIPLPSDANIDTSVPDNTKSITQKTITKEYTTPYYEKIYKLKTDNNGAFNLLHTLPYRGEYRVAISYGGDKTHAGSSKSITIENYSNAGAVFHEELLRTVITTKYSDNSVKTEEIGKKPETKHLKRVITTETYENNKLVDTNTKILYLEDVVKEKETVIETVLPDDDYEDDTQEEPAPTGNMGNPFVNQIPPKNDGTPNIQLMVTNNKKYVFVDTTRSYTLTREQYRAVMKRDSQTMQINNYQVSSYTAFESTDTNTYNVVSRKQWNAIEECILYWLVSDSSRTYPGTVKVDYPNNRVVCDGTNISFKNGTECLIHIVGDDQKWNYTCGPTSCSVCTQVLHNYYSEKQLKEAGGVYTTTGPDKLVKGLNKYEFKATQVSTNKNTALSELSAGRPTVWHFSGHYICLCTQNKGNGKVLIANSATSQYYTQYGKSTTGWHNTSDVTGPYGATCTVKLNWLLSSENSQMLLNYLNCMGGTWQRPDTSESIRRPRE